MLILELFIFFVCLLPLLCLLYMVISALLFAVKSGNKCSRQGCEQSIVGVIGVRSGCKLCKQYKIHRRYCSNECHVLDTIVHVKDDCKMRLKTQSPDLYPLPLWLQGESRVSNSNFIPDLPRKKWDSKSVSFIDRHGYLPEKFRKQLVLYQI